MCAARKKIQWTPSRRTARAKELAAELGFALSGVARVADDGQTPRAGAFDAWIERDAHGPLEYMRHTRDSRARPLTRFPWLRSVLALGVFYDGESRGEPGRDLSAHVARYARGRDYHRVVEKRLKQLGAALIAEGICSRAQRYVDTGPVLERAWAEAAGLGWIGKNACLIHPRLGSFFFLAECLVDTDLEPDRPLEKMHCGTCTRCIDACPTGALVAPGSLDASKCLVSWNIEMQGQTPKDLWSQQGGWAAGCDICQTVCPFNGPRRRPVPDKELASPLPWQELSLAECIAMSLDEYDRAFEASALRRTGYAGMRLGAITAAGNLKVESCRAALKVCRLDPDPAIRERAKWALEQFSKA